MKQIYLVHQVTHIFGRGSRNLDPCLGEEGTGAQHEDDVDCSMDGVIQNRTKGLRGGEVVAETANWVGTSWSSSGSILYKTQSIKYRFSM